MECARKFAPSSLQLGYCPIATAVTANSIYVTWVTRPNAITQPAEAVIEGLDVDEIKSGGKGMDS
jgi:hypothetical protein